MPARVALLVLLAAVGAALARLPTEAPRPPDLPRLPEPRAPTADELDAATTAVRAVGGGISRERDGGYQRHPYSIPHTISMGRLVTAEQIDALPDPAFDYSLWLAINPTTPPGLLARLGRLRNLRRLFLDVRNSPDEPWRINDTRPPPAFTAARVAELAEVPHLEVLHLRRDTTEPRFGDDVAAVLPAFPALRTVTGLTGITDAGAATLARMDRLERLMIGGPRLTDAGLERLSALPRLRDLDVRNRPPLTAASLHPFTLRPRLTRLHTMTQVEGEDVVEEIARIHTLEYLLVGIPRLGGNGRRELLPLARLPRLRVLQHGDPSTDEEAEVLSHFPALEYAVLRLGSDTGVRHLARIRTLRNVQVSSPVVTDAGLAALAELPRLETLGLSVGPCVTDATLDALATAPRLASFGYHPWASTGPSGFTEAGLRRFVAARGPRLEGLSLSQVGVGDDFVAFVAANAPNLRRLGLGSERGITDRSVPALRTLPRLRELNVGGSSSGRPALRELEYQVHGVRVVNNPR